jgi:hypothetical protein
MRRPGEGIPTDSNPLAAVLMGEAMEEAREAGEGIPTDGNCPGGNIDGGNRGRSEGSRGRDSHGQ